MALLAQLGIKKQSIAADLKAVAAGEMVTLSQIKQTAATKNLALAMLQETVASKALTPTMKTKRMQKTLKQIMSGLLRLFSCAADAL